MIDLTQTNGSFQKLVYCPGEGGWETSASGPQHLKDEGYPGHHDDVLVHKGHIPLSKDDQFR